MIGDLAKVSAVLCWTLAAVVMLSTGSLWTAGMDTLVAVVSLVAYSRVAEGASS